MTNIYAEPGQRGNASLQRSIEVHAAYHAAEVEATALAARIFEALSTTPYPAHIDWGHVGDMTETRNALRLISDRMFHEGEHSPEANAR